MHYESALLEDWMRDYYPGAAIDIGSSGVADLSFRDLREITGLQLDQIDDLVFGDSPCTGRLDLREMISTRWGKGDPDWVVTTHGASEGIYVALMTILTEQDHIVSLQPGYHSHTSIGASLGCEVSRWRLHQANDFEPDLSELSRLVTRQTKAIVVNFPNNPTGTTLSVEKLHGLVEIAATADAYLLWDAAFADLVYDSPPLPDPIKFYDKTISVGTFSKAFGLPGMRFGWCQAEPSIISRMTFLRDRITLSISPLLELLACHVMSYATEIIGKQLDQARANRAALIQWAQEHEDLVGLPLPLGGVTAFPLIRAHDDTRELCRRLGRDHHVLLVPGLAFDEPTRVRLGFGGANADFERGLTILTGELTRTS